MPVECIHPIHSHTITMLLGFIFNYIMVIGLIILMLRVIRNTADQITIAPNMRGSA